MGRQRYSALRWRAGFDPETNRPARDAERGRQNLDRVYGYTPEPTTDDGWRVVADIDLNERSGFVVERVTIEPSPYVIDDGAKVEREVKPALGVNSTVLKLVNFPRIRAAFVANEAKFGEIGKNRPDILERVQKRLEAAETKPKGRGGRPRVYTDADKAQWAEDVLAERPDGKVGIRLRLAELWRAEDSEKPLSTKAVASRVKVLRDELWIDGPASSARAGPRLIEWR